MTLYQLVILTLMVTKPKMVIMKIMTLEKLFKNGKTFPVMEYLMFF